MKNVMSLQIILIVTFQLDPFSTSMIMREKVVGSEIVRACNFVVFVCLSSTSTGAAAFGWKIAKKTRNGYPEGLT